MVDGGTALGLTPAQQRNVDSAGSKAAGKHGLMPCPVTGFWLTYRSSPSATLVTKSFAWFFQWWNSIQGDTILVEAATTAWRQARDAMRTVDGKDRWRLAKGPTSSIVATLWDWGWTPAQPDFWVCPPDSVAIVGRSRTSDAMLLQDITKEAVKQAWARSSSHDGSAELSQGAPSFAAITTTLRRLAKEGSVLMYSALRNVAAGGAILGSRFSPQRKCYRCSLGVVEDFRYKFCECPANIPSGITGLKLADKFISDTQWLCSRASWENYKPECLWSRGLIPRDVFIISSEKTS